MLKITDVKLSKNPCKTSEKIVISVGMEEMADYPYDYLFDYPISYNGIALPEGK